MTYNLAGGGTYFLNSSISSTATSITLSSFLEPVSLVPYTMALLNTDIAYATIAPKTTSSEFISFTGITQNSDGTATLTGVTRGLAKKYPFTESTTFKLPHSGQSQFILSDAPQVFNKFASLENANSFTGLNTFTQNVTVPDPVNNTDAANKEWVLTVVNGGPVTVSNITIAGTAGETVVAGNLLYLKASDSRWWKTDADTASTVENVPLGIAQGAGTAGNTISGGVLINGIDTHQTGLSANTVYYASNTAGALSSTPGTKEVTIGVAVSTTNIAFFPRYNQQLTEDEQDALAGGSTFGTPSSTNKFITQEYNSSATGLPVVRKYDTASTEIGSSTTQFDITNPAGTTFRYTYDGTGTDPVLSLANNPVGSLINFQADNFTASNNGVFTVTGAGSNYVEVTNASGVVESNKTIGIGYVAKSGTSTWSKPTGLKYITVEVQAGGGGGGSISGGTGSGTRAGGSGGGGGGYAKKVIQASSLSSTLYYLVGGGGIATGGQGNPGRITSFGNLVSANGGIGGDQPSNYGGAGGTGVGGDFNLIGSTGGSGQSGTAGASQTGYGGGSFFAGSTRWISPVDNAGDGADGNQYGGGGEGAMQDNASGGNGGDGAKGVIILTEYYS